MESEELIKQTYKISRVQYISTLVALRTVLQTLNSSEGKDYAIRTFINALIYLVLKNNSEILMCVDTARFHV